ncbi:MAG: CPBP family intramembrane metalloprotease [Porphyromonas sp.]|nr:CPBP family intramembrane metalloprotease [Porphyromonas sp.]
MMVHSNSFNSGARPTAGYLFSLLAFLLLLSMASVVIVHPVLGRLMEESYAKYAAMTLDSLAMFALPARLVEYYYRRSRMESVWRLDWRDVIRNNVGWTLLLMVLGLGISLTLESMMRSLPVPDLFAEMEAIMSREYEALLSEKRWGARLLIYIGTIVVAPFSEELLFRGGLQGWLLSKTRNPHVAVWLTAFIFGAIHLQWTGFPSRMALGALLGYTALYGGLWLAILFHLLNNLMVFVIGDRLVAFDWGVGTLILLAVLSLVAAVVLQRMRRTASGVASNVMSVEDKG